MLLQILLADAADYCSREHFNKNCSANQIIRIKSALYGRMNPGTCIGGEGYTGCSSDVTRYLQGVCSGRQTCSHPVDSIGGIVQPCKRDYVLYLEAESECVDVAAGNKTECSLKGYTELKHSYGLISSNSYSQNYGVITCPWHVSARVGQRVQLNITVYDSLASYNDCPYSVKIEDQDKVLTKDICGYGRAMTVLYTSQKNTVSVYSQFTGGRMAVGDSTKQKLPTFVLSYRMIGCPDILAPHFSSVKRTGNDLTVRCDETKETWFLTCKNNQWIGEMGNCSNGLQKAIGRDGVMTSEIPFPQGLIVAVVLGLILGVILGFTSLGIYIFVQRRKQQRADSMVQSHMFGYDIKDQYRDNTTILRDTGLAHHHQPSTYYTGARPPTHSQHPQYGPKSSLLYESPIVPDTCVLDGREVGGASVPGPINRTSSVHRPYKDMDLPPVVGPVNTVGQPMQVSGRRDLL